MTDGYKEQLIAKYKELGIIRVEVGKQVNETETVWVNDEVEFDPDCCYRGCQDCSTWNGIKKTDE